MISKKLAIPIELLENRETNITQQTEKAARMKYSLRKAMAVFNSLLSVTVFDESVDMILYF